MDRIVSLASELRDFLKTLPQVRRCTLYGSLSRGDYDLYSDIDIEADVSGTDNSDFVTQLPALFSKRYPVIFYDYAASLAPDLYIFTAAIDNGNPFRIIDVNCVATPHCPKRSKEDMAAMCNKYDHVLKMFSVYLKQSLRGHDAQKGFSNLYAEIFEKPCEHDRLMITEIYSWMKRHAENRHQEYVDSFARFLHF